MNSPEALKFEDFPNPPIFDELGKSNQVKYLKNYLKDLGAKKLLIEPNYFDRDYLSEFSTFYSTSTRGYKNTCKRLHFFSTDVNRELFLEVAGGGGNGEALNTLNKNYLGFCVLRPIKACLGRTVLKWYKDKEPSTNKRVISSRNYKCHIAGVELNIKGLAWQQQDTGVGACATIALWSALQASAFDDFHTVPTTVEVTKAGHKTASLGARTFPSEGLHDYQLYEAIKELGLSPMVQSGDLIAQSGELKNERFFTKSRFISSVASYIRSGYPVILLGKLQCGEEEAKHAVCITGFREKQADEIKSTKSLILMDQVSEILYIHDDNIGANARFKIKETVINNEIVSPVLQLEAPQNSNFKINNYQIIPQTLVVAIHNDLRASPAQLFNQGLEIISLFYKWFFKTSAPLTLGVRFIKLTDYIHTELGRLLSGNPKILSQLRMNLWEKVEPMSLHLGLIRIGIRGSSLPLMDIIYDTTDSDLYAFAHIPFIRTLDEITQHDVIKEIIPDHKIKFGAHVSIWNTEST